MVKLNFILNTTLNGLDVTEMNLAIIRKIKEQVGSYTEVIDWFWKLSVRHLLKMMI